MKAIEPIDKKEQAVALKENFARQSNRTRKAMVTTFLLQGQNPKRMAEILGITEEEVSVHFHDAVNEIQSGMALIPEGPLQVAQLVVEGYSRLVQRVLASCEESQERLRANAFVDPKAETALHGSLKLSLEAMDKLTDRMEKYGLLPIMPKTALDGQQGGVRAKPALKEQFNEFLRDFATENGVNLDDEIKRTIEESVGRT